MQFQGGRTCEKLMQSHAAVQTLCNTQKQTQKCRNNAFDDVKACAGHPSGAGAGCRLLKKMSAPGADSSSRLDYALLLHDPDLRIAEQACSRSIETVARRCTCSYLAIPVRRPPCVCMHCLIRRESGMRDRTPYLASDPAVSGGPDPGKKAWCLGMPDHGYPALTHQPHCLPAVPA